MPREYLDTNLLAVISNCRHAIWLKITLGDGTILRVATEEIDDIGGFPYLKKLAPVDALNLELTRAVEGINLKIRDRTLVLGQSLINTPNILDNTSAMLGSHFKLLETGQEWSDEKIRGKITVGDIEEGYIPLIFKSLGASAVYNGKTISSIFPESEIPVTTNTEISRYPVYDDLSNYPNDPTINERIYDYNQRDIYGRHVLPEMYLN